MSLYFSLHSCVCPVLVFQVWVEVVLELPKVNVLPLFLLLRFEFSCVPDIPLASTLKLHEQAPRLGKFSNHNHWGHFEVLYSFFPTINQEAESRNAGRHLIENKYFKTVYISIFMKAQKKRVFRVKGSREGCKAKNPLQYDFHIKMFLKPTRCVTYLQNV